MGTAVQVDTGFFRNWGGVGKSDRNKCQCLGGGTVPRIPEGCHLDRVSSIRMHGRMKASERMEERVWGGKEEPGGAPTPVPWRE